MRVVLIGADNEENLGMAMIAASLAAARHQVKVVPFTELGELETAVAATTRYRPQLVGLALQFQHRGWEFVELAEGLRRAGYCGHITAGGQFATMAHANLLSEVPSFDSVVLYDGEETIVELVEALRERKPLVEVPGLAVRLDDGCVRRTAPRQIPQDLDQLRFPMRYRPATRHFGVPFVPLSGGRGCWGRCAFCSITSFYRDARKSAGGVGFRLRSPVAIAREMAELTRREQAPCIFCFHDETLLLPRAADTLQRIDALTEELEQWGVEGYGLVGKCRPDCVTPELAHALAARNVIRLYVGIENASQAGQDHLDRRTRTEQLDRALAAIEDAGIFGCYNLLIFEPDTTMADVRENVAFMRAHAKHPVNFCRAEPYHGTPLWERLKSTNELEGSWLGWDYHLHDPKVELLFRVSSVVFRQRNFDGLGVANRSMSLGYMAKIIRHFHPGSPNQVQRIEERAAELTARISLDSAEFLERCVDLVERSNLEQRDQIEREALGLAMAVARRDAELHALIDQFVSDAERYVAEHRIERRIQLPPRLYEALTGLALAGCVATSTPSCGGQADETGQIVDPVPSAGGRGTMAATGGSIITYDSLPYTGGRTSTGGYGVVDPAPVSGGRGGAPYGGGGYVSDALPPTGGRAVSTGGAMIYDPLPTTGGRINTGGTSAQSSSAGAAARTNGTGGGFGGAVDPLPQTGGRIGAAGNAGAAFTAGNSGTGGNAGATSEAGSAGTAGHAGTAGAEANSAFNTGHFRDTRTRRTIRSPELPLYDPPDIQLSATRERDQVRVCIAGIEGPVNTLWESRGRIEGKGLQLCWKPEGRDDQLRVAIRSHGGVTVAALRAKDVIS